MAKIKLPTSWKGVSIPQFIALSKIERNEESDDVLIIIEMLHILSGQPRQLIERIDLSDIVLMWHSVNFIEELEFTKELQSHIKIDEEIYTCNFDLSKMNANQYMALKNIIKGGDVIGNIHHVLSIFFIPVGRKFNDVSCAEIAEKIYDNVSIDIAYPLSVFFFKVWNSWISLSQDYTNKEALKMKQKGTRTIAAHSMKHGVGI